MRELNMGWIQEKCSVKKIFNDELVNAAHGNRNAATVAERQGFGGSGLWFGIC